MELLAGVCMVLLSSATPASRIKAGMLTLGAVHRASCSPSRSMYAPIKRLNKVNLSMNTALSAAERVFSMLDVENEVKEKPGANALAARRTRHRVRPRQLRLRRGSRCCATSTSTIAPGEMVAIVGGAARASRRS